MPLSQNARFWGIGGLLERLLSVPEGSRVDNCERTGSVSPHFQRSLGRPVLFSLKTLGYLRKPPFL